MCYFFDGFEFRSPCPFPLFYAYYLGPKYRIFGKFSIPGEWDGVERHEKKVLLVPFHLDSDAVSRLGKEYILMIKLYTGT